MRSSPNRFALRFACLAAALLSSISAAVAQETPKNAAGNEEASTIELFEAGTDRYALFRIPGIVVTKKGTVLAYCEARRSASGDWGPIDVLMRRSVDSGKTWDPPRHIAHHGQKVPKNPVALKQGLAKETDVTVNNPVAIPDAEPGLVHFLYCVEYARCFYQRSDDDGETFSEPVDITAAFEELRPQYDWKVIATGPGHGIQLKSGRLVVPVWLSLGTGGHAHRPSVVATIYSDDAGKSWHAGEIFARHSDELVNPSETAVAELSDGRVVANVRSEAPVHRRAVSFSPDGIREWTPIAFQEELLEPVCMASLISVPREPGGLLFANPDNLEKKGAEPKPGQSRDRKNLTLKFSADDGKSWRTTHVVEPGLAGYSDLAVTKEGKLLCFFERGSTDGNHYRTKSLSLVRMPLSTATESN